jgi:hypothetical protein
VRKHEYVGVAAELKRQVVERYASLLFGVAFDPLVQQAGAKDPGPVITGPVSLIDTRADRYQSRLTETEPSTYDECIGCWVLRVTVPAQTRFLSLQSSPVIRSHCNEPCSED